jgi:hypothetical protein
MFVTRGSCSGATLFNYTVLHSIDTTGGRWGIHEWRDNVGLEGSGRSIFEDIIPISTRRNWWKSQKPTQRIVGRPAEIRSEYLPGTSPERYRCVHGRYLIQMPTCTGYYPHKYFLGFPQYIPTMRPPIQPLLIIKLQDISLNFTYTCHMFTDLHLKSGRASLG